MKRRNFLKLLGLSPIAPGLLATKEKCPGTRKLTDKEVPRMCDTTTMGADWKSYYVKYDFETNEQTVIEDDEVISGRKFERWFSLKLNPEFENIPGAKEWIQRMEDEVHKECPNPPKYWIV